MFYKYFIIHEPLTSPNKQRKVSLGGPGLQRLRRLWLPALAGHLPGHRGDHRAGAALRAAAGEGIGGIKMGDEALRTLSGYEIYTYIYIYIHTYIYIYTYTYIYIYK